MCLNILHDRSSRLTLLYFPFFFEPPYFLSYLIKFIFVFIFLAEEVTFKVSDLDTNKIIVGANVTITIIDENGVVVDTISNTTNENGTVEFNVELGFDVNITVIAENYITNTTSFENPTAEEGPLDVKLDRGGMFQLIGSSTYLLKY